MTADQTEENSLKHRLTSQREIAPPAQLMLSYLVTGSYSLKCISNYLPMSSKCSTQTISSLDSEPMNDDTEEKDFLSSTGELWTDRREKDRKVRDRQMRERQVRERQDRDRHTCSSERDRQDNDKQVKRAFILKVPTVVWWVESWLRSGWLCMWRDDLVGDSASFGLFNQKNTLNK